ncbi:MAG TPA: LLM class flavin-dependent oxidoreductase [Trueperaceae bacterium]|nr:LLM class flavin-dependent oxidoreductase [Trueperaceae bacterium]
MNAVNTADPETPGDAGKLPLAVLDLAHIGAGSSASEALKNSVDLARTAERLGYSRYWFAEHHGMPSIASSAPEILIGHVASATATIRVGSGGIMLPNHAPLRIAEAFHTLQALHPGRIDLGIGRAPGADRAAMAAMRPFDAEQFPAQLQEMFALSRGEFPAGHAFHGVRAVPSDVRLPPVWLLGSSGASARLAGALGLGYSFASHFSRTSASPPIAAYRAAFEPSLEFARPHAILAVSVVCADTSERAEFLAGSLDLSWLRFRRQEFAPIPTPEEAAAYDYDATERAFIAENRATHFVGTPEQVVERIASVAQQTGADEVMVTTMVHAHADRRRSFELLAERWAAHGLTATPGPAAGSQPAVAVAPTVTANSAEPHSQP